MFNSDLTQLQLGGSEFQARVNPLGSQASLLCRHARLHFIAKLSKQGVQFGGMSLDVSNNIEAQLELLSSALQRSKLSRS